MLDACNRVPFHVLMFNSGGGGGGYLECGDRCGQCSVLCMCLSSFGEVCV